MADSDSIKEMVHQVAMQAATVVMTAFRDTEPGLQTATTQYQWQNQRQRYGGLILEKPRFNCDMPDRYVKLLNFELEVTNILEIRAYRISDEEKVPVIKNWLGCEGLVLMETFTQEEKEKYIHKGTILIAKQ